MATNSAGNRPTAATGTVLQGQGVGTAPAFSTATYPSTATSTGTILRADGTNWAATTATYPNTTTINQILYSSAANTVSGLATANNMILSTDGSGVPSLGVNYTTVTSWTPNLQINSSNTGITYTTQTGYYSRVGNVVFMWGFINLSSKGSSTGAVTISNLPVSTSTNGFQQMIPCNYFSGWTLTNYTSMYLKLGASSSVANFQVAGSGTAAGNVTDTQITNTFIASFQGCYFII